MPPPSFPPGSLDTSTLRVEEPFPYVAHVVLNRPHQLNAMNNAFWAEMRHIIPRLGQTPVRCIVLSAAGRAFSSGLDLTDLPPVLLNPPSDDPGRRALHLQDLVRQMQESFTVLERIPQPVIACVHGAAIGGAIDLVTAADVRYCTADAFFSVKEVDIGLAADVGTLQRLSKVVGSESWIRERAYRADRWDGAESLRVGLVSRVFASAADMVDQALQVARDIASKSPIAVYGTKRMLLHTRDHPVADGLNMVAVWNGAMLQSQDLMESVTAQMQRRRPEFAKL